MRVQCPLTTPKRGLPCSYTRRGWTGLQELRAFAQHLRKAHPEERRSALDLRALAEHNAAGSSDDSCAKATSSPY